MTSYPARINGVASVWKSILNQSVNRDEYHCILVLAEPEFPDKKLPKELQALIDSGDVELMWYPTNIRSHKKLMPVVKKYPNNPILVTDDDVIRQKEWVEIFLNDHRKYPNDIISASFAFFLDENLIFNRLTDFRQKQARGKNSVPGLIFNFCRPANGCGGTLYPAGIFKDKRFFDEKKMMEMSPTSDESWIYTFNIMADRTLRQTSVIFDESKMTLPGSQDMKTALYMVNRTKYQTIFDGLFKEFPEFKKKIVERQNKCIVSLTSYPQRFNRLPEVLNSILNQTVKPTKIVLTLTEPDKAELTLELREMVSSGKIEILTADENLKPHNKYYYVMKKYPEYAIITIDDDVVYANTMVETLMAGYKHHPNCVISRRVHKITWEKIGVPAPYAKWGYEYKKDSGPSMDLFATGVGGVLYPPNILCMDTVDVEKIKEIMNADDIFLKYLEKKKGVKTVFVKDAADKPIKDEETQKNALYKTNCHGGNDEYIRKLTVKEIAKAIKPMVDGETARKKSKYCPSPKAIHEKRIIRPGKPGSKYWKNFFND